MTGTITAIIRKREGQNGGFGFIKDEHGQERFFHAHNLIPVRQVNFEKLREGQAVEFEPVAVKGKGNGLRAEKVRLI